MKRILFWLLSTLTAVVLLFGYHTSTSSSMASVAAGTSVAPATSRPSKSTPAVSPKATTGTSAGGNAGSSGSTGSGGSAGGSGSSASSTVTGDVVATQWGPVQVRLSLTAGRITNVTVLQQPSGNPRDDQINAYALPILTQETTQAQSAQIDMVSGATVTSTGYLQSLQSALDRTNR